MEETMVKIGTGKRGSVELHFNGYMYRLRRTRSDRKYWACGEGGCKATAVLIDDNYLKVGGESHNHSPAALAKYRRQDFKSLVKELALENDAKGSVIFEMLLEAVDPDAHSFILENKLYFTSYLSAVRAKSRRGEKPKQKGEYEETPTLTDDKPIPVDTDYTIIAKPKGPGILVYKGYKYQRNKIYRGVSRWICVTQSCLALCTIDSDGFLTAKHPVHNHSPPNQEEIIHMAVKRQLWRRALTTNETATQIVKIVVPNETDESILLRHKRSIRQIRQSPENVKQELLAKIMANDVSFEFTEKEEGDVIVLENTTAETGDVSVDSEEELKEEYLEEDGYESTEEKVFELHGEILELQDLNGQIMMVPQGTQQWEEQIIAQLEEAPE